jgi:hypothetical protein
MWDAGQSRPLPCELVSARLIQSLLSQRVIERERSFCPLVFHQAPRGFVLFPADGSCNAVRPDFPWGLKLVERGDENENETDVLRLARAEQSHRCPGHNYHANANKAGKEFR